MVAAVTDAPMLAFDYALARRLVVAMVGKSNQIQTLISSLELVEEDVIDAGVAYACIHWEEGKYDPAKGAASTFIQQRANSGIYNYLREEGSNDRKIGRLAGTLHKPDKAREQCDWLKDVFEAAKRVYVDRKANARRTYPMPITVALGSLMRQESLSSRACARLLAQRDDLRAVLKLKTRIPCWRTLCAARALVDRLSGQRGCTENIVNDTSDCTPND